MIKMQCLLVVEDQTTLLGSLSRGLRAEGYSVYEATTAEAAHRTIEQHRVDAMVLDLMLPGEDGLTFLARLRKEGFSQPILVVTARDTVKDRIHGLDSGADDYLVKPFSFEELLARLRALFRRSAPDRSTILRASDLELNILTRNVTRAGRQIELTQRQFDLLLCLMQHAGETVSRQVIAREVWKESTATWTNVIEVQINQLRKKLERPDLPTILHTIRGVGYCLEERR
jgi:DNA-binding response OmpR family regulator